MTEEDRPDTPRPMDRATALTRLHEALVLSIPFDLEKNFVFLDVGAGEGVLSDVLLSRFPASRGVLLEGDKRRLDAARERLADRAGRVRFARAHLAARSWREAVPSGFDLAVSCLALSNLHDRDKKVLIEDLYGKLRPGGAFLAADFTCAENYELTLLSQRLGGLEGGGNQSFPTPVSSLLEWVHGAGFEPADLFYKQHLWTVFGGLKPDRAP